MAIDLFGVNAVGANGKSVGASVTGPWLDTRSTVGKVYPYRITAYGAAWNAGNVIIERIDGDNTVAGNVIQVGILSAPGQSLVVDAPTDYIRARTDANVAGGTVEVLLSQTA